jgi:hypothetical protein
MQYLLVILFPVLGALLGSLLYKEQISTKGLSLVHIAVAAAFLTGVIAFFQYYLKSILQWGAAILLSILYAAGTLAMVDAPLSILALILPNLLFALVSIVIVRYVFFNKSIIRLRTLFMGVCGGIMLSLYLASMYLILSIELIEGFWQTAFVYGLIVYVFSAFGMSVADLIILQSEVRQLRKEEESDDAQ